MVRQFPIKSSTGHQENWYRYGTARAVAAVKGSNVEQVAAALYGAEAETILKAAVAPADTVVSAWAGVLASGQGVAPFFARPRARSSAVRLFEAGVSLQFGNGISSYSVPRLSTEFPVPIGIAEGAPIPVVRGDFGSTVIGPPKKMGFLTVMTGEIASYAAEPAEQIFRLAMADAVSRGLDGLVFSTAAATATLPAGLLNGLTPIAPVAGADEKAMVSDVRNLIGAIADAGGGGTPILIFASPRQAAVLQLRSGENLAYEVVPTASLAAGTVVAIAPEAIVSGFSGPPQIVEAREATLHMDDVAAAISTAGTPNVVSAPVKSLWQHNLIGLRIIQGLAYGTRGPGFVQLVTGATW